MNASRFLRIKKVADCLFCKIAAGEIPCVKVAETPKALCFMDIFPLSKGHCLIIPKEHAVSLHEISEETMAEIGPLMVKVAKGVGAENYNLLQNNGKLAHQEVMHAHFHIIPKTSEKDGLKVGWPARKADADELKLLADKIRENM